MVKNTYLTLFCLLAITYLPTSSWATPALDPNFEGSLSKLAVYAHTYATTGANSAVWGNVFSGDVATTGASSRVSGDMSSVNASNTGGGGATVGGDIDSGGVTTAGALSVIRGNLTSSGAATIGANSRVVGNIVANGVTTTGDTAMVGGYIRSGDATTVGAHSVVSGNVASVGVLTVSQNGGSVGSSSTLSSLPLDATWRQSLLDADTKHKQETANAQKYLGLFGLGSGLGATMTTDTTLLAGTYSAANFSTTAGTTLKLDAQGLNNQTWVFNIADYLVTGASTTIELVNAGLGDNVFWNTGGYASLGASSVFAGSIFANTYISVGAQTTVMGMGGSCAGVYSATSYVSTGDGSQIGSQGCTAINADEENSAQVPEPATLPLTLTGLVSMGFTLRRRKLLPCKVLAA